MTKKDDFTRYTVRIPTDLYERLKTSAGIKSVNAEIVERLAASFAAPDSARATRSADEIAGNALAANAQAEMLDYMKAIVAILVSSAKTGAKLPEDALEMLENRLKTNESLAKVRMTEANRRKPKDAE